MKIAWTPQSLRAFKRIIRKKPTFLPLLSYASFIYYLITNHCLNPSNFEL